MGVHCPLCEEPFQGALAGTYFQPSLLHGIWSAGRPDKFYFSSTQKLQAGKTIQIFNYGNCKRDFTYVDDIVEGILRVMQGPPGKQTGEDGLPLPPYAVYNIGGGAPENLLDYISTLLEELVRAGVLPKDYDIEGHRQLVGMQLGDMPATYADSTSLERDYGFTTQIGIREGLRKFAEWYVFTVAGTSFEIRGTKECSLSCSALKC